MFPIQLSEDILPSAIFYGSLVPVAFYFVLNKFVIEPYIKDKKQK
jgi:DnaJ family protein C protein 11